MDETNRNDQVTGRAGEKPPTIIDVAAVAGVSKSTVSNVLRNRPGVADDTRRRVQQAVERLGYRTNIVARQLVQQRTAIMGVMVGDLTNPFYAEMMKLLERHAAQRGYTAMFCNTEGDSKSEMAGVNTLLDHRVAGIIFLAFTAGSRAVEEALASRTPVIFVSCWEDRGDSVAVDDQRCATLAIEHLIDLGHRRIGYLTTSRAEFHTNQARRDGYRRSMETAGLPVQEIFWPDPPVQAIERNGHAAPLDVVLQDPAGPTALFCYNDLAAIDLVDGADRLGLGIPGDISVVGFDDVDMAGLARLSLTTIAQPREQMARLAIDLLAERIDGSSRGAPRHLNVEAELVVRASTGPPPRHRI